MAKSVKTARKGAAVAFGVGATRGRMLRGALLGTTAIVGVTLAAPAAAQTVSPAGGGTVVGGGGNTTDQTATGGGLRRYNLPSGASLTVNGVTINQTTSGPTVSALSIEVPSGASGLSVTFNGTNAISTTVSGGAAVSLSNTGNMGVTFASSGSTFTGSYGLKIANPNGFVNVNSTGQSQSFIGNGTAVAGISVAAQLNPEIYLGSSTISGFATGVYVSTTDTRELYAYVKSTGGSISASQVGIDVAPASASNGSVDSQSAITAPIGIRVSGGGAAQVTTSGAGTINSTSAGTGTGILASNGGGATTTNNVQVSVGAAIGNTTSFATGVSASNGGTGGTTVTSSGAITVGSGGTGISATTNGGAISVTTTTGGTINGGLTGISISGSTGANPATLTIGAAVAGSGFGVNYFVSGGSKTTNLIAVNADVSGGAYGIATQSASAGVTIASGVTVTGGTYGVVMGGVSSLNNMGTIKSTANSAAFNADSATMTAINTGLITGTIGATYLNGFTLTNGAGGTITGTGGTAIKADGTTSAVANISLLAGSAVNGAITLSNGSDTLQLYNGQGAMTGGALAAATFGSVDLGGGTNTLTLRGVGDDRTGATTGNGAAGTIATSTIANVTYLSKQDSGTWLLTGSGAYAGTTTISGGTLVESNTGSALGSGGTSIASGATLEFANTTVNGLNPGQLYIKPANFSGAGTIKFTGTAMTAVGGGGGNVTISLSSGGLIDVEGGLVQGSSSSQGLYTGNLADLYIASGATFDGVEGAVIVDAVSGGGTLKGGYYGSGSTTIGVDNGSGTFSGVIADSNATTLTPSLLKLTKNGTGTQTLSGVNTYTGTTTINGGKIALSGAGSIASSSLVTVTSPGTLDLTGVSSGASSIVNLAGNGTVTLGATTLTLTNGSGTFSGAIGGSGGLTKQGAGTFILAGTDTYTGVTTVSAGTLQGTTSSIAGSSIAGSSIADNATLAYSQAVSGMVAQNITGTGVVTVTGLTPANQVLTFAGTNTQSGGFSITDASKVAFGNSDTGAPTEVTAQVANATIGNTGMIAGVNQGIRLLAGGTVNNTGAGATIKTTSTGNPAGGSGGAIYSNGNLTLGNSGTISNGEGGGNDAVTIIGVGTIVNSGTVTAASASGFAIAAAGSSVTNSGTITGGTSTSYGYGIAMVGGTVANNAGTISATLAGIANSAGSVTITNASGASIKGANTAGIYSYGTSGLVLDNSGTVQVTGPSSGGQYGVYSTGTGAAYNIAAGANYTDGTTPYTAYITNRAGGFIVGTYAGVGTNGYASITNAGTIGAGTLSGSTFAQTTQDGIRFLGGGAIVNQAGGYIGGNASAIYVESASTAIAATTVTNAGTINGVNGIYTFNSQGKVLTVNNQAGGVLTATNGNAIYNGAGDVNLTNAGTVQQTGTSGGQAVNLTGTLTLANSGTITNAGTGTNYAIYVAGALASTSTNSGIIAASGSDGLYVTGGFGLSNSGDIAGASFGIESTLSSTANTLTNTGRIVTGTIAGNTLGGAATIAGFDAVRFAGGTVTNGSTTNHAALIYGQSDGVFGNGSAQVNVNNYAVIQSNGYAGVELNQAGTVHNYAGASIVGGSNSGIRLNAGGIVVNDATASITDSANVAITAIAGSLSLDNSGSINGYISTASGVPLTLVNRAGASITCTACGGDLTYPTSATVTVVNAGLMSTAGYSVTGVEGNGSAVITNAATGSLVGGSSGIYGGQYDNAIQFGSTGTLIFNNYGSATTALAGGNAIYGTSSGAATLNLFAGSTTGRIGLGSGNDTINLYTGAVTTTAATIADPTNAGNPAITVQAAGAYGAASVGAIALGGITNAINLRGVGTDVVAGGAVGQQGALALDTISGMSTLTKQDSGNWVLSGAVTDSTTKAATIYAGNMSTPGATGVLQFNGTTGLTGTIYVNGATVQVSGNGALGAGTVHMVDPTITFISTSTQTNAVLLDVATAGSGATLNVTNAPATFQANAGVVGTLSGNITTGTGTNIDNYAIAAAQPVTIAGLGTIKLTGANNWTGATTINAGATLAGTVAGISGSNIVDNGTLNYTGATTGTVAKVISGTGAVTVDGGSTVTFSATNIYSGLTTVSGTGTNLTLTGGTVIADANTVAVGNGGTLTLAASEAFGSLVDIAGQASAGNVALGGNTLTLGGNNADSSFAGVIGGTGGVTKQGTGTLTLSGANSFTGTLLVSTGTLAYGASNVLADTATVTVSSGATFNLNGFSDTIGTLNLYGTLSNGGLLTATNYNAYAGSTINQGIGGGALNIYGNTTINSQTSATPVNIYAGTLTTGSAERLSDTGAVNIASGATLALGGAETIGSLANLGAGGGTVQLGANTLTAGGDNTTTTFAGVISGSGGFTKAGTGTLTLSGGNNYAGTTMVSGGTLQGTTTSLVGANFVDNATLAYSQTASGTVAQAISGTGRVTVTGLGNGNTLTFSGTDTQTGGFVVTDTSATAFTATATGGATEVTLQGASTLTNSGKIVGTNYGVYANVAGATITNSGTIASGSYDPVTMVATPAGTAGVYLAVGGTVTNQSGGLIEGGYGAQVLGGIVTNQQGGTIIGAVNSAFQANGVATFVNAGTATAMSFSGAFFGANGVNSLQNGGTITGATNGARFGATGVASNGSVVNSGSITGSTTNGILSAAALTITNNSGAAVTGATYGVNVSGGALTLDNFGAITGNNGTAVFTSGAFNSIVTLEAGSSATGGVVLGGGADTLTIYNGQGTGNGGTLAGATVGTIDLGGGGDTLLLRGAGDGTSANGAGGTLDLSTLVNAATVTKQDAGTWTLTGASTGGSGIATINAGTGGAPGSAGMLAFNGTTGLAATIYVNGATVQASGDNALGMGTVHMVDPTLVFATASATYANNFVLDVARPGQGSPSDTSNDPSTFQANAGVVATLTGSITTGMGNNVNGYAIDPNQPVVIAGAGAIVLTNAGNAWTGVTTVNGGATLQGTTASISGGSITDNGVVNFSQTAAGTSARAISGAGVVQVNGGGNVALTGAITTTGGVQVGAGGVATLSNASGASGNEVTLTGAGATVNVAAGGSVVAGANAYAVYGTQANAAVNNAGTLSATNRSAVYLTGAGASVVNSGTISIPAGAGGFTPAVLLLGGGTVTNNAGLISGGRGVYVGGAGGTIANYARITGLSDNAVSLFGNGNVTNYASGTLTATASGGWGVLTTGAGTVDNQGTIVADSGLVSSSATTAFTNEGTITATVNGVWGLGTSVNLVNTGTISGGTTGVRAEAAGSSIANSGTIRGSTAGGVGVYMAGGTLTNQSGGSIVGMGTGAGIVVTGSNNSLALNAGSTVTGNIDASATTDATGVYTLAGTLNGGFVGGTGGETVTLVTGATVSGTLDGGAGSDTLVLTGTGAGALNAAQVVNIEIGTKTGTGTWTLTGTATPASPTAWSVNAGTLTVAGGNAIADTASVSLASGATLTLAANEAFNALSGAGNVVLGANTLTLGSANGGGSFAGIASGTGGLTKIGTGTQTLAGASSYTGATTVSAGTLALGGANAIGAGSAVSVASGATFNLATYSDTVASVVLNGTLGGTGTLTAATYTLNAATVAANLGAGSLTQASGVSVLSGTSNAGTTTVNGGTLRLGASDRIVDTSAVSVASGATFDLAGYNETVGSLTGAGAVTLGAGTLSAGAANTDYGFGGTVSGTGDLTKVGTGTMTLTGAQALTGRVNANAGTLLLLGSVAGGARVQGGTLAGTGQVAGNLAVSSGTLSPGTLTQAIGTLSAGSLTVTGGTTVFDFAGATGGFTADRINVAGAVSLTGGLVSTRATEATANYRVMQTYTLIQAGSVAGTFANGGSFSAVSNASDLFYRLRYDLVPGSVLLEVRKQIDFTAGLTGASGNQLAVGGALNGSALGASDAYATVLNQIQALSPGDRASTYNSISGEGIADISTSVGLMNQRFTELLRRRLSSAGGSTGNGTLVAALVGGARGLADARASGQLDGASSAFADGTGGEGTRGGAWVQSFGGYGLLRGQAGSANLYDQSYGVAGGIDARLGPVTVGIAGSGAGVDTRVTARGTKGNGTIYQGAGYAAYDDGKLFANAVGTYFSGDVTSRRSVYVGTAFQGQATGKARAHGYGGSIAAGYRIDLGGGTTYTPQVSVEATHVRRDAFTETGAGVLSLAAASQRRTLYQADAEGRLSHRFELGSGGTVEPYVGGGINANWGDRMALDTMQITGAPAGTGAFVIDGAHLAKYTGLLTAGVDGHPSDRVTLGLGLQTHRSPRQKDGAVQIHARIAF